MADIDVINVGGVDYNIKDTTARNAIANAAPVNHASTDTKYGSADSTKYGHVKLTDNYYDEIGYSSNGIAVSQGGIFNMYSHCVRRYEPGTRETQDLNNLHITGVYTYGSAAHRPTNDWGEILVSSVTTETSYTSYITQIAFPYGNGENLVYRRWYNSDTSTWSSWVCIANSALIASGTATKNTTYVNNSDSSIAYYRKGNICYVNVQAHLTNNVANTFYEYSIASGLPAAAVDQYFLGNASCDWQNQGPHFHITTNGRLNIMVRAHSVADQFAVAGFVYIC